MRSKPSKQRAFIGLSEAPSGVCDAGFCLAETRPSLTPDSTIEFVPLYGPGGLESLDQWAARHGRADKTDCRTEFIDELSLDTVHLDKAWHNSRIGASTSACCIAFALRREATRMLGDEQVVTHMSVPDETHARIMEVLEEKHGVGNVFVSKQVIPILEMRANWSEFAIQGKDWLNGQIYRRPKYDCQTHAPHSLLLAVYCIPISIAVEWPRKLTVSEYDAFCEKLSSDIMPKDEMDRLMQTIHPDADASCHLGSRIDLEQAFAPFEPRGSKKSHLGILARMRNMRAARARGFRHGS